MTGLFYCKIMISKKHSLTSHDNSMWDGSDSKFQAQCTQLMNTPACCITANYSVYIFGLGVYTQAEYSTHDSISLWWIVFLWEETELLQEYVMNHFKFSLFLFQLKLLLFSVLHNMVKNYSVTICISRYRCYISEETLFFWGTVNLTVHAKKPSNHSHLQWYHKVPFLAFISNICHFVPVLMTLRRWGYSSISWILRVQEVVLFCIIVLSQNRNY